MNKDQQDIEGEIGAVVACKTCGSERVVRDAWACWNPEAGLWELETVFDDAFCNACENKTDLIWKWSEGIARKRVRELNDQFRRTGQGNGMVVATSGLRSLGSAFLEKVMLAVQEFDAFSEENDPWGEHDFGAVMVGDSKVFWKIDCFDPTLTEASRNAANDAMTMRVLTLMLAEEY